MLEVGGFTALTENLIEMLDFKLHIKSSASNSAFSQETFIFFMHVKV